MVQRLPRWDRSRRIQKRGKETGQRCCAPCWAMFVATGVSDIRGGAATRLRSASQPIIGATSKTAANCSSCRAGYCRFEAAASASAPRWCRPFESRTRLLHVVVTRLRSSCSGSTLAGGLSEIDWLISPECCHFQRCFP